VTAAEYHDETPPDPDTVYRDVEGFFLAELRPILERPTGTLRGVAWCDRWAAHPEAVYRLTAVWEAWEVLREDGGAWRSNWLRLHLDEQLEVLFDREHGPFAGCASGHAAPAPPLPHSTT
jgi:hypothetical protein